MLDMTAQDLLKSLIAMGLTQVQISAGTGINQPTVSRVLTGVQQDVTYSDGQSIETFFRLQCERRVADRRGAA